MIFIDLETYSELDVRAVGAHKYALHPSTEILLCAYAIDDGPVRCWDLMDAPMSPYTPPRDFLEAWDAELNRHQRVAHHAAFERLVLGAHGWESSIEDWEDTAVLALTCGLPAALGRIGDVLGLGEDQAKGKDGARLIQLFCKPNPANYKIRRYLPEHKPAEWQRFKDYCIRDVEVTRLLWRELPPYVYAQERRNWLLDQRINDRGLPIDVRFAMAAELTIERATAAANAELAQLTGDTVTAVSQVLAMREWLEAQGLRVPSLDKAAVEQLLADEDTPPAARRVLELRQAAGRSSVAKYRAALTNHVDGRLYGSLQFYGANRTGRDAGRQLQPQNMKRPSIEGDALDTAREVILAGTADLLYPDPFSVVADSVRGVIAARPGKKLVVSDLANIEGRMLAWLAGEEWVLDAFRAYDAGTGPDLYKLAYARAFDIDVEQVTKPERQVGKVLELFMGFQGGFGAFVTAGAAHGVFLPESTVVDVIARWRGKRPRTRALWRGCEEAAVLTCQNPGRTYRVRDLRFRQIEYSGRQWLVIRLPSGRSLFYFEPELVEFETKWGTKLQLRYTGQIAGGTWGRIATYGGKLVENITQAAARDVLFEGAQRAEAAGYPVVLRVHDEAVAETPDSPEYNAEALSRAIAVAPTWCPDLPLAASGYESTYYRKD